MRKTSHSEVWVGSLGVPSESGMSQSKNSKSVLITPLIDAAPMLS